MAHVPVPTTALRSASAPRARQAAIVVVWALTGLAVWALASGLEPYPRLVLTAFALAIFGWVATRIDDSYIALLAALLCAIAGSTAPSGTDLAALGDPLIWLLLGTFVIGAAITASGLSARIGIALTAQVRSVRQLFYVLTAALTATAFVIPSTTARAAVMVPVFVALTEGIQSARIRRALALLIPTVIVLSAFGSLTGAGGNLLAVDALDRLAGVRLDYVDWLVFGLPFALVSCFASAWVILHLFLDAGERRQRFDLPSARPAPTGGKLRGTDRYVIGVVVAVVGLWLTEPLHGLNNALVALAGALAATMPGVGPITLKQGLQSVEWPLLLFLAASLVISGALLDSGASGRLVDGLLEQASQRWMVTPGVAVIVVALVGLLAHLLVHSRTARAAVLIPQVVMVALVIKVNAVPLTLVAAAALGYCVTLPISAKPFVIFTQQEHAKVEPAELLLLSSVLLPFHFVFLLVFGLILWPMLVV